ncbi:MAG: hypothetical protein RL346_2076 [Verrucomicrobiota bacterium]
MDAVQENFAFITRQDSHVGDIGSMGFLLDFPNHQ